MLEQRGHLRRVDGLGRVVLLVELRRRLGIAAGDQVEIWVDGDRVRLARHVESCVFCGGSERLSPFKGKPVCAACLPSRGVRA